MWKCLGTNVVGTKDYRTVFSGILSSWGLLHSDWLLPIRFIAHYHKVDLTSTLLDAHTVQDAPRHSRRSSLPVFCRFVLPCQIFLPPIKTVGSTIRQRKMLKYIKYMPINIKLLKKMQKYQSGPMYFFCRLFKIYFCVFLRRHKVIQVWNHMRINKW